MSNVKHKDRIGTTLHRSGVTKSGKQKIVRDSVLDTGRKCEICPRTILVTTQLPIIKRESKKYCSNECRRIAARDKKISKLKFGKHSGISY